MGMLSDVGTSLTPSLAQRGIRGLVRVLKYVSQMSEPGLHVNVTYGTALKKAGKLS